MNYDVIVIGASSAGLFAAELLSEAGKRVALFEKEEDSASCERTYIVTQGLFRTVPDFDQSLIRQQIDCFNLISREDQVKIPLSVPDLVLERAELLRYFSMRAEQAGVEIIKDSELIGFYNNSTGTAVNIRVQGEERLYKTNNLIGADGYNSQVRDLTQLGSVFRVPLLQALVDFPESWDGHVSNVWFDVNRTEFFFWAIPDRDHKGVIGLIGQPEGQIRQQLEYFLEMQNIKPISYQAGQVAVYEPHIRNETKIGNLRIILVGDAAGQVKMTTVGGTVTGLRGSKAAVEAILSNSPYRSKLSGLRRELWLHHFLRTLLNEMKYGEYDKLISQITPAVQGFLRQYDRDEIRGHIWKLAIVQPEFVPLGLELLARKLFSG